MPTNPTHLILSSKGKWILAAQVHKPEGSFWINSQNGHRVCALGRELKYIGLNEVNW